MRFTRKARIASLIAATLLATGAATSATAAVDSNSATPSVSAKAPAGAARNIHNIASTIVRDTTLADYTSGSTGWGLSFRNVGAVGADHFEVPAGHTWRITSVVAPGFWMYGNPGAIPISLQLFNDASRRGFRSPGQLIAQVDTYSSPSSSDFTFNFGERPIELKAGTYWFSVTPTTEVNYGWYHWARYVPGAIKSVFSDYSVNPRNWKPLLPGWTTDVIGHNVMIVIGGTDKY